MSILVFERSLPPLRRRDARSQLAVLGYTAFYCPWKWLLEGIPPAKELDVKVRGWTRRAIKPVDQQMYVCV